jgi:DNA-binding response OmpR family regulator
MKVLIADDDFDLLGLIAFTLEQAGFFVIKASDGKAALQLFNEQGPDLVLLDINMPGANGFDVCARIREQSTVPVMMLTVRGEEEDLVKALELGADDYLNKPFSPRTLIARVKALLRRAGLEAVATPMKAGQLQLNVEEHTVRVGERDPLRLTKLEARLLQMLLVHPGQTITSDRLLMQVWGHKGAGDRQLLKQLVHRVRQKIEVDPSVPQLLQTMPNAGYKLLVD